MKKIFIALSVLAVLAFSMAPVQANVPGARDISPGSEFNCYFLVSQARVSTGSGPSTLYHMSETKGKKDVLLHFNFYDFNSNWVYNLKIPITHWATLLKDVGTMLINASDTVRAALAVTYGGEDYYAGYIVVTEITYGNEDNILVDVLQLDLASGIAALSNVLAKAYVVGIPTGQISDVLTHTDGTDKTKSYEVFSGDAMAAATNLTWGGDAADATWFALYPKYLINDSSGITEWIILRSSVRTTAGALVGEIPFHTWVINGAEDYRSITITIRELTILDADAIIPSILKVSYPYIGQVNLRIPGDLDPGTALRVPSDTYLQMEMVGWEWFKASSAAASLNWAGMANMGADAGTYPANGYNPSH